MRRWIIIIGAVVIVGFFLASGCAHVAEVSYPTLTTPMPEDMRLYAGDDNRVLTMVLTTTNSVAASASGSTLTDGRGRQYRVELDPAGVSKSQPVCTWYKIRAYGPTPSTGQLAFGSGSYSIALSYTNLASAERVVVTRPFVIRRRSIPYPIVWIVWLFNPQGT